MEKAITREEVIAAENELFSAQLASDVDRLDQLLHDDLIAINPAGQVVTKETDLAPYKAKTIFIEAASTAIDEIKITGETALSIVTMTAKGKVAGTPLEGQFRYLRVWSRVDYTLKVIAASFMQLA